MLVWGFLQSHNQIFLITEVAATERGCRAAAACYSRDGSSGGSTFAPLEVAAILSKGRLLALRWPTGMSLTLCPCMAHHRQTQHPSTVVTMRTQTDSHLPASSEVNQEAGSPERMPCCHLLPPSPSSRPRTAGAEGRAPALVLIFTHRFSGWLSPGRGSGAEVTSPDRVRVRQPRCSPSSPQTGR